MTTTATATVVPVRPTLQSSNSVRISLQHGQSSLSSYQTTCISKHYALNNHILGAFENNYENQLWLVAYHVGLKFLETALLEIPQHGYFYSSKFAQLRLQATVDSLRVCNMLQDIIAKEPQDLGRERRKIELLHTLALEQYERLPTYEDARKRTVYELIKAYPNEASKRRGRDSSSIFTSTLLACGDKFSSVFCPNALNTNTSTLTDEYKSSFPDEVSAIAEEARRRHLYPSPSSEDQKIDQSVNRVPSTLSHTSLQSAMNQVEMPTPSLLDKYDDDATPIPPSASASAASTRTRTSHRPPSMDPKNKKKFALPANVAIGVALDTPDPPPTPPPPPSSQHLRTPSDYDLQRVLFLSGLHVDFENDMDSANSSFIEMENTIGQQPYAPPGAKKRDEGTAGLPIAMLAKCYHEDFDTLRNRGRVTNRQLPTYQGRISGSINGCTIIAPLLCIHHFLNQSSIPDPGLPDQAIVQVIDEETPNILPAVRHSLGLVKDAFLIPADAHESLMQQQYMCHEQFLTVCGGNILDEQHIQLFLDQISVVGSKKLAASFFFHEHVITILQLRRSAKSAWFDVIDSLPHRSTFVLASEASTTSSSCSRSRSRTFSRQSSDSAVIHSRTQSWLRMESEGSSGSGGLLEHFLDEDEESPPMYATRIRCTDVESLKATLLWYACSVFTEENCAYIDNYEWDEKLSDFDPRVFQAFIWTEA